MHSNLHKYYQQDIVGDLVKYHYDQKIKRKRKNKYCRHYQLMRSATKQRVFWGTAESRGLHLTSRAL